MRGIERGNCTLDALAPATPYGSLTQVWTAHLCAKSLSSKIEKQQRDRGVQVSLLLEIHPCHDTSPTQVMWYIEL